MQVFDHNIYDIVEHGLEGKGLSREEARALYAVPERTREAALIRWAGQEFSLRAADGIAEIHGQIGLNATKRTSTTTMRRALLPKARWSMAERRYRTPHGRATRKRPRGSRVETTLPRA